jgi:hypothetical protein
VVQVPAGALQTSQPPAQALLQQYPSAQLPLAHSRHAPGCRQWVARSHAAACGFCPTQFPPASQ